MQHYLCVIPRPCSLLPPSLTHHFLLSRLNISDSDMVTITDGEELATRILGRYVGGSSPFKLFSTTPDLTVTFHSDPAGLVFGKGEGFIINYMGENRKNSFDPAPSEQPFRPRCGFSSLALVNAEKDLVCERCDVDLWNAHRKSIPTQAAAAAANDCLHSQHSRA